MISVCCVKAKTHSQAQRKTVTEGTEKMHNSCEPQPTCYQLQCSLAEALTVYLHAQVDLNGAVTVGRFYWPFANCISYSFVTKYKGLDVYVVAHSSNWVYLQQKSMISIFRILGLF